MYREKRVRWRYQKTGRDELPSVGIEQEREILLLRLVGQRRMLQLSGSAA